MACDAAVQERISFRYSARLVCLLTDVIVEDASLATAACSSHDTGVGGGDSVNVEKVYEIQETLTNLDEWMYELREKVEFDFISLV